MKTPLAVCMHLDVTIVKDPMEVLVTSLIILRPSTCPTPQASVMTIEQKSIVPVNISVPNSSEYSDRMNTACLRWRGVHVFLMQRFTLSKTFVIVLNTEKEIERRGARL